MPSPEAYCLVGVGETAYTRNSGRSTRALAVEAVKASAIDAGIPLSDIDGMLSFHYNDSVSATDVAHDLGIRLDFSLDMIGGGASTEALVGVACGVIEVGMCRTVAIFRSMNGRSGTRMGGSPSGDAPRQIPIVESSLDTVPYGVLSAAQQFQFVFVRHMFEYGTTPEQLASVKVVQSRHASNNPRALQRNRVSVEDVTSSPWVVKPACHLLDCCLETDGACCVIVTTSDIAKDLRRPPVYVTAVAGRVNSPFPSDYHQFEPVTRTAGANAARHLYEQTGLAPADIDLTSTYDCFTFPPLLQFEAFGFCDVGAGGEYVTSGAIELGGQKPNNTSGGQLCEGYTNGMNLVIENVRQLRHQADDSCPRWEEGVHSYDYEEGGCRQVRRADLALSIGWGVPSLAGALILRR